MTLPEQHPTRRRVALRSRTDSYRMPAFRDAAPRQYAEPTERYDARNEARPLDWRELNDPVAWGAGLAAVLIGIGFLAYVFTGGPS